MIISLRYWQTETDGNFVITFFINMWCGKKKEGLYEKRGKPRYLNLIIKNTAILPEVKNK